MTPSIVASLACRAVCALAAVSAAFQERPTESVPDAPVVARATPRVRILNPASIERREIVRFSMPWPRGRFATLSAVQIANDLAPCVVLERWPDGSVALVQVHADLTLAAAAETVLDVVPVTGDDTAIPATSFAFPDALPVCVELDDPWGRRFEARLEPDPVGAIETWASSPRIRVRRFRAATVRTTPTGDERFLAIQAWLVEFGAARRAELTLVLDNDPRRGEPELGPVRFRRFALRVEDPRWRVLPRYRAAMLLPEPVVAADGTFCQDLLGPSDALYLGDRTGKAFRFDVFVDGDAVDDAPRRAARVAAEQPVVALPDLEWVRATAAFGAVGGPGPAVLRAAREPVPVGLDGGPFGAFGEPRVPAASAGAWIGPSPLQDLLRAPMGVESWQAVELRALQYALRPTPGAVVRSPEEFAPLRAGLSPRAQQRPHGFAADDYENLGVARLHDAWWLTGDPFVRHQLARVGAGILPLLRAVPFRTSRGEGVVLDVGVRIARATGDRGLLDALTTHVHDVLLDTIDVTDVRRAHAIEQPPHGDALGPATAFDAPVQMAILVAGLHALGRATDDAEVRRAEVEVARRIAENCWIEGAGPARFVSARDPRVRAEPLDEARSASDAVIAAALALAADTCPPGEVADRLRLRAAFEARRGGDAVSPVADRWLQIYADRVTPAR